VVQQVLLLAISEIEHETLDARPMCAFEIGLVAGVGDDSQNRNDGDGSHQFDQCKAMCARRCQSTRARSHASTMARSSRRYGDRGKFWEWLATRRHGFPPSFLVALRARGMPALRIPARRTARGATWIASRLDSS